jgi:hypothetical protein
MKKFTLVSLVAAAAFATTATFSASNVFAADDGNKNLTTNGDITLTKADGTTDTQYPYTDITLVKAANVDFGSQSISTSAKTYSLKDGKADNSSEIVNVVNPGVASGWAVTASASAFTDKTTGLTLKGAQLTLGFAAPTSPANTTDGKNQSAAPSATSAMISTDGTDTTGKTVFAAADANTGVGDWSTTVNPETTTLSVPAGNVAGTYHAEINWTLTNSVSAATSSDSSANE